MPNIKEKPKNTRVRAQDKASLLPQQAGRMLKEKYLRQLDTRPDTEPDGGEYATGEVESGTRRAVDEVTGAIARKPKKERAHTQPSHPSAAAPSGDVPNTERSRPANPQKERSAQPPETAPKERIVTHAVKERTATPHFAQHAASASKPPVETSIGGFAMPERRIALIKERISTARSGIKTRASLPQPRHTPAPKLKSATVQTTAKRLVRKTRQTAQQHMKRRMVAQAQKAAAMISSLLGILGGGFLLIALVAVIVIAAVANSPFGLFFAAEKNAPDTVSVAEAEGLDVATLDADRVDRLTAVFWDMTAIATYVEEIYHSGSGDDDGWAEYILHITITAKTAEEMRTAYGFNDYQNSALDELLSDPAVLSSLAGSLTITGADANDVLDALPGDLAFFPDNSHIGIVVGRNADGILIVHCASSRNNVVITDCIATGFTAIGRPDAFD